MHSLSMYQEAHRCVLVPKNLNIAKPLSPLSLPVLGICVSKDSLD
jgi:hypothetical protein